MRAGAGPTIAFARRFTGPPLSRPSVRGKKDTVMKTQTKKTKPARTTEMDRREFLATTAAVGGGLVLGFWLPGGAGVAEAAGTTRATVTAEPWYRDAEVPEVNAWIAIGPDDTVTIRIAQTEIGTGVLTCNSMIVADELQCDFSKVRVEMAAANRDYKEKAPEWTLKVPGNGVQDPGGAAP